MFCAGIAYPLTTRNSAAASACALSPPPVRLVRSLNPAPQGAVASHCGRPTWLADASTGGARQADALSKTPTRSAKTPVRPGFELAFSPSPWRWALIVRSAQPNERAACLLRLPPGPRPGGDRAPVISGAPQDPYRTVRPVTGGHPHQGGAKCECLPRGLV